SFFLKLRFLAQNTDSRQMVDETPCRYRAPVHAACVLQGKEPAADTGTLTKELCCNFSLRVAGQGACCRYRAPTVQSQKIATRDLLQILGEGQGVWPEYAFPA